MSKKLLVLLFLLSFNISYSATHTVTTTADSGAGSLRQAIIDANADASAPVVIDFSIASGVQTITPLTVLPSLTNSGIFIDGTTQPGWSAGDPQIVIDGTSAAFGFDAFTLDAVSTCTIQDLVINNGFFSAITIINGANNNSILGCFCGVDQTGTTATPNAVGVLIGDVLNGVIKTANNNNVIGAANHGNVLSGNNQASAFGAGIAMGGNLNGTIIQGNFIGTDKTGTSAIPNFSVGLALVFNPGAGGDLTVFAANNIIGGSSTAGEGNVISGNSTAVGLVLGFQNIDDTVIKGNKIGVDATGTAAVPNGLGVIGVPVATTILNGTIIGGANSGEGNVISANPGGGVGMQGDGAVVKGNFIGTDITGTVALGNGGTGLNLQGDNNIVGGSTAAERNIISNNGNNGIEFAQGSSNNTITGNYIGVDSTGAVAMGNGNNGIRLVGYDFGTLTPVPSNNNIIGGALLGQRNIISNNSSSGILLDLGCNDTIIKNNYVGVDVTGGVDFGNNNVGIQINGYDGTNQIVVPSDRTIIGGAAAGEGNIISRNNNTGIQLNNGVNDTVIRGNNIGVDVTGTVNLGNGDSGIQIQGYDFGNKTVIGSNRTLIGGAAAGEGNIISGNNNTGIQLNNGVSDTVIKGNKIGVDTTGLVAIPNGQQGIQISGFDFNPPPNPASSNNTIIGGTTAAERNIISGNQNNGIQLNPSVNNTTIQGNYIGVGSDGTTALGNNNSGIQIAGTDNGGSTVDTLIGGITADARNIISGNNNQGIFLQNNVYNTLIKANYIGVDVSGAVAVPNTGQGILVQGNTTQPCNNTIIGGATAAEANIIAANTQDGILLQNNVNNSIVQGNYVGTDDVSTLGLGNGSMGIHINGNNTDSCVDNIITGNVSANNAVDGIWLDVNVFNTVIQGNFIGTDKTGTIDLGNLDDGIQISGVNGAPCVNNLIGGTDASQKNIITFNNTFGVTVGGDNATPDILNSILGNSIFLNSQNGIFLHDNGNNLQEPPVINSVNFCDSGDMVIVSITAPNNPPASLFRLELFLNTVDRNPITEGETFIGAFDLVPSGVTVTQAFPAGGLVSVGQWLSATATNYNNVGGTLGDTSEFTLNTLIADAILSVTLMTTTTSEVCPATPVDLILSITGSSPYDVLWSDGFVQSGVISPVERTVTPLVTTVYSATVFDVYGCSTLSNDITILVSASAVTLTASAPSVIPGGSVILTATPIGTGPFTLTWSDGLIQTGVTGPESRTFTLTQSAVFSVTSTDSNGCVSAPAQVLVLVGGVSPIVEAILRKYCFV